MTIGNMVCLVAGIALGTAAAQSTPPAKDSGITRQPGPEVDLGPDLPGYKMKMTTVTFAPGAVEALHDHKKVPAIAYVLQGKVTEFTKAGGMKEFAAGEPTADSRVPVRMLLGSLPAGDPAAFRVGRPSERLHLGH